MLVQNFPEQAQVPLKRKGGTFFLVLKVLLESTIILVHSLAKNC